MGGPLGRYPTDTASTKPLGRPRTPSSLPAPCDLSMTEAIPKSCYPQDSTTVWATRKLGWVVWHQLPYWKLEGAEG